MDINPVSSQSSEPIADVEITRHPRREESRIDDRSKEEEPSKKTECKPNIGTNNKEIDSEKNSVPKETAEKILCKK